MADAAPARGGFRGGFGAREGRGVRGRGRGRGARGRGGKEDSKEWVPVTKLGRLVREGKIKSLEEIYLYSLPIKEFEIIDFFLGSALRDEVLKIMPVQKQTRAGQRTRFKAFVAIGDNNGHIGLGVKCSKEFATAIRGAIILAKLSVVPVHRGYWGNKIGKPHTVPCKVTGKCGSVSVRLIPAPRGTGIVSAPVPNKLLTMAGIEDCYTSARGSTGTLGNFAKATYAAIANTYAYLTPDFRSPSLTTPMEPCRMPPYVSLATIQNTIVASIPVTATSTNPQSVRNKNNSKNVTVDPTYTTAISHSGTKNISSTVAAAFSAFDPALISVAAHQYAAAITNGSGLFSVPQYSINLAAFAAAHSKRSSIADLRMKAKKHSESLGFETDMVL
ncbi:GL18987 [Drosophila persimilis]|uniref:Small ribosomal subunit protein uS5 n=1 Tax=Drosophila persimilis TaxID=7234 RepID=B4G7B4_DROPE|nr:GL18987 [Drosophila persimilis]